MSTSKKRTKRTHAFTIAAAGNVLMHDAHKILNPMIQKKNSERIDQKHISSDHILFEFRYIFTIY